MLQILNLNRMNDALFKDIFAQNSDITFSLINSVFEFQGTALVTDIEFIDRNLDAEEDDGKESQLDLLGRSSDGTVSILKFKSLSKNIW